MNSPVRAIHFARVVGPVAAQLGGEVGEIVARVWLGEYPAAATAATGAAGAIVRTAAGWHYVAPLLAGVAAAAGAPDLADVSSATPLRSTQSRADLERQILQFYRGEAADEGGPWAVAS
jgi:arylamine N-acetyltransferase